MHSLIMLINTSLQKESNFFHSELEDVFINSSLTMCNHYIY